MSDHASWFWNSQIEYLRTNGYIGANDVALLMAACDLYDKYRKASEIADFDVTDQAARGAVIAYVDQWKKTCAALGMTPAERQKFVKPTSEDSESPSAFARKRG